MPAQFERLELGKLSAAERLELVGDIWDSLAAEVEAAPLPPAFCAELERRIAAHRADPSSSIPWEEVQQAALARLQKARLLKK